MRNVNSFFNKEGFIKDIVEVNIYYEGYKKRTEIDIIGSQKWSIILRILWLACYNPKIDWRIGKVKIMRCLEEYRNQSRRNQNSRNKMRKRKNKKKERSEKRRRKRRKKKEKTKKGEDNKSKESG